MDDPSTLIFAIDPRIRYAAVHDRHGNRVAGGQRPGTPPLTDWTTHAEFDRKAVQLFAIAQSLHHAGPLNHLCATWHRLLVFLLPYLDHVLVVTAEPDFGLDGIMKIQHRLSHPVPA